MERDVRLYALPLSGSGVPEPTELRPYFVGRYNEVFPSVQENSSVRNVYIDIRKRYSGIGNSSLHF